MKNKILRIALLIVGVIIILLSIYYLKKYLESFTIKQNAKQMKQTEHFEIYQPIYNGDPKTIDFSSSIIENARNPALGIDGLQYVASNNKSNKLFAIVIDRPGNIAICSYDNTNSTWNCLYADITNISGSIPNFTQINPSTTLPQQNNNIVCRNSSGYLLAVNSNTLFYYNQNINNAKKINCLYYLSLIQTTQSSTQTILKKLNCLALPDSNQPSTTSSSGALPNLSYDKLRLLCANDYVILAMGCSNTLYYYPLANGLPNSINADASGWKTFQCGVDNSTIKYIGINDTTAFIYANTPNSLANTKLIYSSIGIDSNNNLVSNWLTWISGTNPPIPNRNPLTKALLNLTVNNDVMWAIDVVNNSGNQSLWWCPLKNGLPYVDSTNMTYIWQQLPLSRTGSIFNIVIFNNQLIIYLYSNQNLIIPLYNSNSNSSNTTRPNPTATGSSISTTRPNPTATGSSISTTTPNPTATGSSISTTTPNPTATGSSISTTTLNSNIGNIGNNSNNSLNSLFNNNSSQTQPITTDSNTNLQSNSIISTTMPQTNQSSQTTKPANTKPANTNNVGSSSGSNGNIVPSSFSGMFGINDNVGNRNNLNDFLANTNMLGNNLYISPMNNPELYNPTQPKINGKISSSFFPMVKIN